MSKAEFLWHHTFCWQQEIITSALKFYYTSAKLLAVGSSLMRLGSFLPTDDQHYFSTKGSRLRYQLIFPRPLSPIIKPNLYEIKIESWCLIMVPELDDNINRDKFWKLNNEDYTKCKIYVDYIIFMTHD